jgi:membrane-associated PAP2 superfamily phosphatase
MNPRATRWRQDLAITGAALGALLAWEWSGLDLRVSAAVGGSAGFPWRHAWSAETVLHDGGRWFAAAILAALVIDAVWTLLPGPRRRERILAVGLTLVGLVAVPALKRGSASSCPWDLIPFGGTAPYVPHWLLGVLDGGPGHCFPSGHATSAFAFFAVYFFWRGSRPRAARRWAVGVLAAGLLFGVAQTVRGAHFVSHTLWSGWLCWAIGALGARWWQASPGVQPSPLPAGREFTST